MICLSCGKSGKAQFSHGFCRKCFLHIIEKRVRKHVRSHFSFKKGSRVVVKTPLLRYFLENVVHVPLHILSRKMKPKDTVVLGDTLDDVVVISLASFLMAGGTKEKERSKAKQGSLFSCLTDAELAAYCKFRKLSFAPKKHPLKQELHRFNDKHPDTLHALAKSLGDVTL